MKIFIASANIGKIREIEAILNETDLELISILDAAANGIKIDSAFDVEETGQTFQENAFLKAKAYANLTGLSTIADDSGLEVMALGGFPSVQSNRWFQGSTSERNEALLNLLKDKDDRKARFYSVICFFDPQKKKCKYFDGEIKGQIATEQRGSKIEGFGYDPIFIPEGYKQSFAELGVTVKNTISHRKQALLKLSQHVLQDKHLEQHE